MNKQHKELIAEIRSGKAGRERVISDLYADGALRNGIKKIVRMGGGSDDDAQSILNFTLVQLLKGVMEKKDFAIESNINSYLFGIARNLWLQELRKRKKLPSSLPEDFVAVDETPPIDLLINDENKRKTLAQVLEKLGRNCKQVLMLWAANYRMKEIATQLNYKSEGVVRKKKLLCMKELNNLLDDNPAVKKQLAE